MAIVSGHIIPKSAFEDDQHANFSMETKDGKFVNKSVYVLLYLQAMISSTLPESATVDERTRSQLDHLVDLDQDLLVKQ